MGLRTWQIEAAVVALVLSAVTIATGSAWREWIGAVAGGGARRLVDGARLAVR